MHNIIDTIINTCVLTRGDSGSIAYYSHVIPVFISTLLALLITIKSRGFLLSKIFLAFVVVFSVWLVGDLITWTSNNYYLVYSTWSFLDYIEIVFYALGFYFASVFVKKEDLSLVKKVLLFLVTLPALYVTVTHQSVTGFNYPACEAFNNDFLGIYKLAVESLILFMILIYATTPIFQKFVSKTVKKRDLLVLGSIFLFLAVFGITEYLASVTGYYELNLYSLFLLPVFLVAIIYSVFELDIFSVNILGTHYLVVGLVILMGGQLFFITNTINRLLTIIAMAMAIGLSFIIFRNFKKESDQRTYIEKINLEMSQLIKQRESLLHLVTHKVKGSFTRTKYLFAGMLDGTFGEINDEMKRRAMQGMEFDNTGIQTIDLVLNAANLQKGSVKYEMEVVDFQAIVLKSMSEKKIGAESKGLQLESTIAEAPDGTYHVLADVFWLKEAVNNLIENAIQYTKAGKITVGLVNENGKVRLSVKDTGVGITEEDKQNLFTEGGHGKDSIRVNVDSTGYGLYSVKLIVDAHKGKVWAESLGQDKGSTFFIELDAVK